MNPSSKRLLARVLFSTSLALVGCGGGSDVAKNQSPQAAEDPARLEKAKKESEEAAERAKKAELAKTKGRIKVENP